MEHNALDPKAIAFLKRLGQNNNREWFAEHKSEFKAHETDFKKLMNGLMNRMSLHDHIEKMKVFRIYRDVRFSKNKAPYKTNLSCSFSRKGAQLRGGYYVHVEPGGSFIATGFWGPNKDDLFRIRKELESDADEFRTVISNTELNDHWGELVGEEVKTAPKGFDRDHQNIDLIKKKQFIFTKKYSDKEVIAANFVDDIDDAFKAIRPYFDLMSDILTTDVNGESLLN